MSTQPSVAMTMGPSVTKKYAANYVAYEIADPFPLALIFKITGTPPWAGVSKAKNGDR